MRTLLSAALTVVIGLVIIFLLPLSAAAAVVQHLGTNDPTTEFWTKGQGPNSSAAAVIDSGTPAWNIKDGGILPGEYLFYLHNLTDGDFNDPTGWTYTARLRVVDNIYSEYGSVSFAVQDHNAYFMLS